MIKKTIIIIIVNSNSQNPDLLDRLKHRQTLKKITMNFTVSADEG